MIAATDAFAASSMEWFPYAKDWITVVGVFVGLVGGIMGMWSVLRPPKIVAAHMDHLGVVVEVDRTTHKLHLPLVLANLAKKPGAITLLALSMRPVDHGAAHTFEWGLFWKEDPQGNRIAERRPAPIPVPGYTSVERSVQFDSRQQIPWTAQTYKFTLQVRVGRSIRLSYFYTRPSEQRLKSWYQGAPLQNPWVDDLPVFRTTRDVPKEGV